MSRNIEGLPSPFNTLPTHLSPSQAMYIEQYPGWQGTLSLAQIVELLDGQPPFTYLLSFLPESSTYLLSYTGKDQMIAHVQFAKDKQTNNWTYKNGSHNAFKGLSEMIKQAMHCEEEPIPIYHSKPVLQP